MKDVELTEFMYPCITYVLRRTGLDERYNPQDLIDPTKWERYPFDESIASPGDIVCWDNNSVRTDCTLTMTNGTPISTPITIKEHFGVYEGYPLVSDLVVDGEDYAPRIRVTRTDVGRAPDYIRRPTMMCKQK